VMWSAAAMPPLFSPTRERRHGRGTPDPNASVEITEGLEAIAKLGRDHRRGVAAARGQRSGDLPTPRLRKGSYKRRSSSRTAGLVSAARSCFSFGSRWKVVELQLRTSANGDQSSSRRDARPRSRRSAHPACP
jgi:hypothetical protein